MLNPNKKFVKSKGVDIPIMYVYLAGRISGDCIQKCLEWRQQIVDYYKNYKNKGVYPISFLDALNSKEADSIDKKGLESAIPPNLIYDKDLLSVKKADVVVAMMDDYMEEGIQKILDSNGYFEQGVVGAGLPLSQNQLLKMFQALRAKILDRRPNWGTDFEISIAMYLGKPTILIAGNRYQKNMLEKHPFMKRASVIVESVEELLEKKWLQILYKSISSSLY